MELQDFPLWFGRHADLNVKMRAIILDWLFEVSIKFKYKRSIWFDAAYLLDQYMIQRPVFLHRNQLQGYGLACFHICGLLKESYPMSMEDLSYICDRAYSKSLLHMFISDVVMVLDGDICLPETIFCIIDKQSKDMNQTNDQTDENVTLTIQKANYFAHFVVMNWQLLQQFTKNELAFACLLISCFITKTKNFLRQKWHNMTSKKCVQETICYFDKALLFSKSARHAIRNHYHEKNKKIVFYESISMSEFMFTYDKVNNANVSFQNIQPLLSCQNVFWKQQWNQMNIVGAETVLQEAINNLHQANQNDKEEWQKCVIAKEKAEKYLECLQNVKGLATNHDMYCENARFVCCVHPRECDIDIITDQKIGEGGYGTVYEAFCKTETNKRFAIKQCNEDDWNKSKLREIACNAFLRKNKHFNILIAHQVFLNFTNDDFYLQMPFSTTDVSTFVRKRCPNEYFVFHLKKFIGWARQLLEAVCFLHSHNIVHRDIKPSNVLMFDNENRCEKNDPDNFTLKICDFGASHQFSHCNVLKEPYEVGTFCYLSLEMLHHKNSFTMEEWKANDMWSTFMSLTNILIGKRLVDGFSLSANVKKIGKILTMVEQETDPIENWQKWKQIDWDACLAKINSKKDCNNDDNIVAEKEDEQDLENWMLADADTNNDTDCNTKEATKPKNRIRKRKKQKLRHVESVRFISDHALQTLSLSGIDFLLKRGLCLDSTKRQTAKEALEHDFLKL